MQQLQEKAIVNKRSRLALVFLSTHSKHDSVGLLRFCFFLSGSDGDALSLVLAPRSSRSSSYSSSSSSPPLASLLQLP